MLFLLMFHITDSGAILFVTFIGLLFCTAFLSLVDTEYICNSLNLPYTGDVYEVRIESYYLAYIVSIFPLFIPFFASVFFIFFEETKNYDLQVAVATILMMIILIWIIGCMAYKKKIRRNSLKR